MQEYELSIKKENKWMRKSQEKRLGVYKLSEFSKTVVVDSVEDNKNTQQEQNSIVISKDHQDSSYIIASDYNSSKEMKPS